MHASTELQVLCVAKTNHGTSSKCISIFHTKKGKRLISQSYSTNSKHCALKPYGE